MVKIKVGIGGQRIVHAGFLARHIHEHLAVRMPRKRFYAAERLHRGFKWFIGHNIPESGHLSAVEGAYKRMRNFRDPLVPMLVHKVVHHASGGFRQVGIYVGGIAGVFHIAYDHHFLFVRRKQETADAACMFAGLGAGAAVGVHCPHLHVAVGVGIEECYAASAIEPHRPALAFRRGGDAHRLRSFLGKVESVQLVV